MVTKVCSRCGVEKPEENFYLRSKGNTRETRCKKCSSELSNERQKEQRRLAAIALARQEAGTNHA